MINPKVEPSTPIKSAVWSGLKVIKSKVQFITINFGTFFNIVIRNFQITDSTIKFSVFFSSSISKTMFYSGDIYNALFTNFVIKHLDFQNNNAQSIIMRKGIISNSQIINTQLQNSEILDTSVSDSTFNIARLAHNRWNKVYHTRVKFDNIYLHDSYLRDVQFIESTFVDTDFINVNFEYTKFITSHFSEVVDFTNAVLDTTEFKWCTGLLQCDWGGLILLRQFHYTLNNIEYEAFLWTSILGGYVIEIASTRFDSNECDTETLTRHPFMIAYLMTVYQMYSERT